MLEKQKVISSLPLRVLDILLIPLLLLSFSFWATITFIFSNTCHKKNNKVVRLLGFTTSSNYDHFNNQSRITSILNMDKWYPAERRISLSPFRNYTRVVHVSDKTTFIDWGTDRFTWFKNHGLKYSRLILRAWDFFHYCIRLIKYEKITVIRSNNPFTSGLIAYFCARLTRTPFCAAIRQDFDLIAKYKKNHELPSILGYRSLAKPVQRFVLSHADRIIPTNESRAQYAKKYGAKSEKIRLDPFPIDPAIFPKINSLLKKELGIQGKRIVSFVGRLVKDNYIFDVVKIAAKICQQRDDVVFLIVGDGVELNSIVNFSNSLMLGGNIRFLGMQKWEKAIEIRQISDVSLVLKAGNSLVEAAIAGCPLIAYDVDWHYELVRNGETGFLLPEGDVDGVVESINKILLDFELKKRLGDNARKLAIKHHGIDKIRQIKINFYNELLQGI